MSCLLILGETKATLIGHALKVTQQGAAPERSHDVYMIVLFVIDVYRRSTGTELVRDSLWYIEPIGVKKPRQASLELLRAG